MLGKFSTRVSLPGTEINYSRINFTDDTFAPNIRKIIRYKRMIFILNFIHMLLAKLKFTSFGIILLPRAA